MKRKGFVKATMLFFCLLSLFIIFSVSAMAETEPPEIKNTNAVYLYDCERDVVMVEQNANKVIYPASTVKIMTGLIAIENLSDRLDEKITVDEEMLGGVRGNNISLDAGEIISIRDLLFATLCGGANDAASVLAHTVAGSIDGFLTMMNSRCKKLGAEHTYYENVTGMHSQNMVTTAYDTFLIAKEAAKNPLFLEITSESKYQIEKTNKNDIRVIYNRNYMISRYSETKYYNKHASGINSGSTKEGGYCLATYAENEGRSYICVVMGAEEVDNTIYSYQTANELINWAFDSFGYIEVLDTDRLVCEIGVELSESVDYVTLCPESSLTVFLPIDTDIEKEIVYEHKITSETLTAPVKKGQVAGFMTIKRGDEVLGTVNLVTMNDVKRSEFLYVMQRMKEFTGSRVFIASAICLVVLIVAYVFISASGRPPSRKRRRHRRR